MTQLSATAVERTQLSALDIDRMFALYQQWYCDTLRTAFEQDLADKTHCIVLRDEDGNIHGFSTVKHYRTVCQGASVCVVFSGDTIIDPAHWGNQQLAFAWIRLMGTLKRQAIDAPLYWFLISKGYRTYRYMSAFGYAYAPCADTPTPVAIQALMDHLATERFGDAYDPATGLLSFAAPRGRLTEELAQVPEMHRRLPEVAYFLERNPAHARGDELVCLCELSSQNMRPLARRIFSRA